MELPQPTAPVIENHCPFGCQVVDLNELGYCRHLVGFTNDRLIFEALKPIMNKDGEGKLVPSGSFRVMGKGTRSDERSKVLKSDKLVNPTYQQKHNGVFHTAYRWVSWRVYRAMPDEPNKGPTLEDLAKQERINKLKEELAELQGEPQPEPAVSPHVPPFEEQLDLHPAL